MNNKILIFLHIPKTGGVTLQTLVKKQYPENRILNVGITKNKTSYDAFEEMLKDKHDFSKYVALMGHLQFGIDNYMISDCTYMTMLRDPVKRYISQYLDILRKKKETHNHLLRKEFIDINSLNNIEDISFEDFLQLEIADDYANLQTRYLCDMGSEGDVKYCNLETAKKNLSENNLYFGILERFDESLILFKKQFGWRKIFYVKKNKSNYNSSTYKISQNSIDLIKKKNKFDMELYSFANKLFEKRILQLGKSMEEQLKIFRRKNKIYSLINFGLIPTVTKTKKKIINRVKKHCNIK